MADHSEEKRKNQALLDAFDRAIESAPWNASPFLQAMRNHLIELRDRFKQEAGLNQTQEEKNLMPSTLFGRVAKRSGLVEVYIVLYNTDGANIFKWESILQSVAQHVISRPTYRLEQDAKANIRAATTKMNEAYICVFIHEEDILPPNPQHIPKDRLGHELINLKEGAVHRDNIKQFVHVSGVYEFKNERLIRKSVAEFL